MLLLVVEDDDRVAGALAGSLRRHGFDVARARTGTLALDMLNSAQPDLVLLDLGLPDRDGFDICTRIRLISTVPIIMVTARAEQADRLRGLYTGADDYVVKPFDVLELIARIHVVTRRSHQRGDASGSRPEPGPRGPRPPRGPPGPPPAPGP
ncbi:response regulator transcription factor, partial [Pseudofrankia sp. BMG5.37]|uniref:response regulator transcription factor n=1 Tax=Pseudofrankia sp. BMG5.37 TaxID=3050035 RepID=UPI002894F6B3